MNRQYECRRCGKLIEYSGRGIKSFCPECRAFLMDPKNRYARAKELERESRDPYYNRLTKYDGRLLDHLDITLLKCKELGLTYAQYQVEWQLAQLPPIGVEGCTSPRRK